MKLKIDNKSGSKNVHWNKQRNKWTVMIRVDKKQKYIGLFEDLELAELVATEARDKYHKEFVLKLYRRTSDGEWQYYFTPGNTWNKSMGLFSASPHITTSEIPTSDLFRRVGAKEAEKFIEKLQSK